MARRLTTRTKSIGILGQTLRPERRPLPQRRRAHWQAVLARADGARGIVLLEGEVRRLHPQRRRLEQAEQRELVARDAPAHLDAVEAKLPRKVKRKRPRADDPDASEEYYAFVFPDDARKPVNLKILEMAKQWKRAEKARAGGDSAATGGGAT